MTQVRKKHKQKPKLFLEDYTKIIDQHFGKDQSPILDIIAWHIHQVTYDIIQYNQEF